MAESAGRRSLAAEPRTTILVNGVTKSALGSSDKNDQKTDITRLFIHSIDIPA
jgi:hypothetical protein